MFRHIVLLTLSSAAPDDAADSIVAGLSTLPAQITEIRSYSIGTDAGVNQGNADVSVVADFDDRDGYLVYRDHLSHRAVIDERITPVLESRSAIQYEL
jgi:Stress responsive A/B Barrel Domain